MDKLLHTEPNLDKLIEQLNQLNTLLDEEHSALLGFQHSTINAEDIDRQSREIESIVQLKNQALSELQLLINELSAEENYSQSPAFEHYQDLAQSCELKNLSNGELVSSFQARVEHEIQHLFGDEHTPSTYNRFGKTNQTQFSTISQHNHLS